MTKQQMIEKIYEVMANKELTFGCKVYAGFINRYLQLTHGEKFFIPDIQLFTETEHSVKYITKEEIRSNMTCKIIGHPLMYGDACDWIERPGNYISGDGEIPWIVIAGVLETLTELWKFKRLPIDNQDDDCIEYLYSLISK